jgi:peptidyl-prolyl cis-trans isomerase C
MSRCLRLLRVVVLGCAALAIGVPAGAQQPPASPPPAAKPQAQPQAPTQPTQQQPRPAQANTPLKDPVVATINGQPIRLSELEVAQQALPPQYRNMPLQAVFPALLDRIIDSKLVVADGRKNKVTDDAAFKKRMAFVEDQVLQDFWLQREIAKRVTAEKMKQRYDERLKSMPAEEEVHARHILVSTEDEAKALIAELKKGAAFDKLAKEKSTDKASGAEGGDLGWFKRSDMVKEFADAAFALKKDELTETPVKTQFGYHVIKLEDRRQAPPPAFDELSDQIREELARETVTQILDQLRSGAKIEKFNIDGSKPEPQAAKPAAPAAPAAPAPGTPAPAAPSK